MLVGIGLARFAYTPLIPALIDAQWFTAVAGGLSRCREPRRLPRRCAVGATDGKRAFSAVRAARDDGPGDRDLLRLGSAALVRVVLRLALCLRLAGGVLMVLAAPTVLPHVPPARRGLAGGAIFTGVGLGIVASGTLVPHAAGSGLGGDLVRPGRARPAADRAGLARLAAAIGRRRGSSRDRALGGAELRALYAEYGLNAFGLVPHMVFLVVYVAHGLGEGLAAGAQYWVLFGVGAVLGPMLAGHLADRIGFAWALRLAVRGPGRCRRARGAADRRARARPVEPGDRRLRTGRRAAGAGAASTSWYRRSRPAPPGAWRPRLSPWDRPPAPMACPGCSRAPATMACCSRSAPPPSCWRC